MFVLGKKEMNKEVPLNRNIVINVIITIKYTTGTYTQLVLGSKSNQIKLVRKGILNIK